MTTLWTRTSRANHVYLIVENGAMHVKLERKYAVAIVLLIKKLWNLRFKMFLLFFLNLKLGSILTVLLFPSSLAIDAPIYRISDAGLTVGRRPIGWLRGLEQPVSSQPQQGIALLRLSDTAEAMQAKQRLYLSKTGELLPEDHSIPVHLEQGVLVNPFIPSWWPSDIISGIPQLSL